MQSVIFIVNDSAFYLIYQIFTDSWSYLSLCKLSLHFDFLSLAYVF